MERLDLALPWSGDVSEQDSRDEDREEPGSVGDGRDPVDHARAREHANRVERRARQANATHYGKQEQGAGDADGEAHRHLGRELGEHDREAPTVLGGELDHSDHEGDPDGVVRAGLSLEDRSRPAPDLPAAENGERDRRVGRRDCGTDQAGRDPGEVEEVVRCDGDDPGGCERPDDA